METVRQLVPIILQGSLILMIMAIALECRWSDFVAMRNQPRAILKAIVAVNIVVPAVAVLAVLLLPLERPVAIGLILMAVSPLAPLVPGNALKAGGDRAHVLRLYVALILVAIVLVPVTVTVMNVIFGVEAVAPMATIAQVVLISAVVPIALGLALAAMFPTVAKQAARIFTLLSNIVLLLFILLVAWKLGGEMLAMIGDGTILAFFLVSASGIVAGHLLGGPGRGNRGALALAAAIRHPGMAGALVHANNADPKAMVAVLLFLLNGVIVTTAYQLWLKRQPPERAPAPGA